MKKLWSAIILLGMLAGACGGSPNQAGPEAPAPASNSAQPAALTQPDPELSVDPDSEEGNTSAPAVSSAPAALSPLRGPGDVDLADPASGLGSLPGYQAVLEMSFTGEKDGKHYQAAKTYSLSVLEEPAARLLVEVAFAPDGANTQRLFADLSGVTYRQESADGPCLANLAGGEISQELFEPARLLPRLSGAERTGEETLNGTAVQVIQFDSRALGVSAQGTGTARIAIEGGYLLSYSLTLEAGEDVFGSGVQGKQSWEYTLTQSGPEALKLPEACPQENLDLPALPDAQNKVRLPGYLRYTTNQDAPNVSAFYNAQLAPTGWQPAGDPLETGGGTRWLYLRLVSDKEQTALLTTQPVDTGLEVILAVLP